MLTPDEAAESENKLCLDFSNTVDWRNGKNDKNPQDGLKSYEDLVEWSKEKGTIGAREAGKLSAVAREKGQGAPTMRRAIELREIIYRIFSAVAHGREPNERDIDALNDFLANSLAKSKVVRRGSGFQWAWREEGAPDKMLWPIARSAADLLTSDQLDEIRECANEDEGCAWLFIDQSRNHSRRWCSMKSCGNKAKARKYYEVHARVSA